VLPLDPARVQSVKEHGGWNDRERGVLQLKAKAAHAKYLLFTFANSRVMAEGSNGGNQTLNTRTPRPSFFVC